MKSSKKILLFLGFFLAVGGYSLAAEKQQEQSYVPKIIIDAPWGQKNLYMDKELSPSGEFGIRDPYTRDPKAYDQGPVQGPSTFTVSPNGNIYIQDTFNQRIQIFTPEGILISSIPLAGKGPMRAEDIAVDVYGNIYLLSLGPTRVYQLDSTGNLLKTIYSFDYPDTAAIRKAKERGDYGNSRRFKDPDALGMEVHHGSTKLFCDTTDRLFLQYRSDKDRESKVFQLGTATTVFTQQEQKATLRSGSVCNSGIILNKGQIFQVRDGKMFSVDNADKSVTEYKSLISPYSILDVDAFDNVYLIYYNVEKNIHTIRKQTADGQFISTFEWNYEKYQLPSPYGADYVDTNKQVMIDANGNVYVLAFTNKGLTITKWSPSEAGK